MRLRSVSAILLLAAAASAAAWHYGQRTPTMPADRVAAATRPIQPLTAHAAQSPVLVELFTSQGCSSCPPADAVMARLNADPAIVAISRPVTYWDNIGWRDTLARPANTDLQHAYAARGLSDSSVYTPEAVIGGRVGMVGSREAEVRATIAATSNPARLMVTGTTVSAGGAFGAGAIIKFVATADRSVRIGHGENGGRVVRYTNVVLDEATQACASAMACSAAVPARIAAAGGRIAVILQRGTDGEVLAARWL